VGGKDIEERPCLGSTAGTESCGSKERVGRSYPRDSSEEGGRLDGLKTCVPYAGRKGRAGFSGKYGQLAEWERELSCGGWRA